MANLCKEKKKCYEDGRDPDRKFTSPLHKLRALVMRVLHRTKTKTTVLKPVFDYVYVNTKGAHGGTITVMIVSNKLDT